MKKALTVMLALITVLSLTAVAHADVIAEPAVRVYDVVPWVLVAGVVGVTAFILRKFWKKKK